VLDISRHQNGGAGFTVEEFETFNVLEVIVKLGGSNNPKYPLYLETVHQNNARAAGLTVGHYWANGPVGTAQEIADRIHSSGQVKPGEELWWDVEDWPEDNVKRWTPQETVARTLAAQARGIKVEGIYLNNSLANSGGYGDALRPLGLKLWLANYNDGPCLVQGGWRQQDIALRQYTSVGKLEGYDGNLDLNRPPYDVWTVERLQAALNANGADLVVDNDLGPATVAAIAAYQAAHGLVSDGVAGSQTLTSLGIG
jgi:hypothetical protein